MGGRSVETAAARTPGRPDKWQVNIVVETDKGKDTRNTFGVSPTDLDTLSVGDMMEPPIGPTGLAAYFPRKNWGRLSGNYASDIQAPGATKTWTFEVQYTRPNERVVLRWPDLTQLPARTPLMLTDELTGQRISMRTMPCYRFNSGQGGIRRFTVSAGDAIQKLTITNTQVQRNRATGSITLNCGVSIPAEVTMRLRSTSGKIVRTLGPVKVGAQGTLNWDGRDDQGRNLPAGIYVGELFAESTDGQKIRANVTINTRY